MENCFSNTFRWEYKHSQKRNASSHDFLPTAKNSKSVNCLFCLKILIPTRRFLPFYPPESWNFRSRPRRRILTQLENDFFPCKTTRRRTAIQSRARHAGAPVAYLNCDSSRAQLSASPELRKTRAEYSELLSLSSYPKVSEPQASSASANR